MSDDRYQFHDYFKIDELLDDEYLLIRQSVRDFVKQKISPQIEECAQQCKMPEGLVQGLGEIGAFGPFVSQEYGGAGLDYMAYGIMMQELERCDSGVRSTASVQGSLVMYPIYHYGSEEQKNYYLLL